jgi:hypothetical protein
MHENSLKNLQKFQPGQSGNPAGRPTIRTRLTERFIGDVSDAWSKHGASVLERMAKQSPTQFAGLCAALVPKDVQVSLSARLPGNLEPDEWTAMLELLGAVRTALPGDDRQPGEIADFVADAIRSHSAKLIEQ